MNEPNTPERMRPRGGYRALHSFRTATLIYDGTVSFCGRFVNPQSRLVDQMVQAARSGRQNIAEGSRASATSSQTELRLVSVARASLDELLLDYEDYLRQHGMRQWDKSAADALALRAVAKTLGEHPQDHSDQADQADRAAYARWLEHRDSGVVANALICLIHQANYLLDRQLACLERAFINDGGYSEALAAARLQARRQGAGQATSPQQPSPVQGAFPPCPKCGGPLVLRTARQGSNAGSQFLGCAAYPACKGTRAL
jgi:four helix bundle suffix protein